MTRPWRADREAWVAGTLLWAAVCGLALLGPSRATLVPSLAAYSLAFGALGVLWLRHPDVLDDPWVLLGGAVLLRLTMFPSLPDISDDLYRYVWDGWLSVSGVNPFRYVPSDPRLTAFQGSELFGALNSPDYHSIYPPLSQIVFALGGALYQSAGWPAAAYGVKAGFVLLETVGLLFLFLALRELGRRPGVLALYAWNPLVLVTLAGGGHSEGGLVLGMGLVAWGITGRRVAGGWVGLALATSSKGLPLLLAPLLLRHHLASEGVRRSLLGLGAGGLVGLLLLAPFYFPGIVDALASSADLYVRLFEFNAGLYFLLDGVLAGLTGADWGRTIGPLLRWGFLAAAVWIWVRWPIRRAEDLMRGGIVLSGLYLVTATTVHPWYIIWGLVWIPFTRFLRSAWLWASWAAFLTYFFYAGVPQGLLAGIFWGGVAVLVIGSREAEIRDVLLRMAGRRKARQVAPHLKGDLVLDVGAGEGYVARGISGPSRRVVLVEVGPYFRVDLPGVVYDGRALPFPDRSVDTVLVSLVLHHAHDADAVISEILRVARHRVVVTESTYRWSWERKLLTFADRCANRTRGMTSDSSSNEVIHFRTVGTWEDLFHAHGARVLRSERLNRVGHRHHLFVLQPGGRRHLPPWRDSDGTP